MEYGASSIESKTTNREPEIAAVRRNPREHLYVLKISELFPPRNRFADLVVKPV